MRAAGLHAIATVLSSEAVLITSKSAGHAYKHPEHEPLIQLITSRIAGFLAAQKYVICQYNIPREHLHKGIAITPGRRAPTITALDEETWVAVSAMVERNQEADVMDRLTKTGARDILLIKLDNCRV